MQLTQSKRKMHYGTVLLCKIAGRRRKTTTSSKQLCTCCSWL